MADGGRDRGLVDAFVDLATVPDDSPDLDQQLERVVRAVVQRVPAVDFASTTAHRGGRYSTVAMSGEIALAVDQAQYDGGGGPCMDAAGDGVVTAVSDTATVVQWPGFRDAAVSMGLRSSLSIPLFTASGRPSIALNLYAHRPAGLMPLAVAVDAEYRRQALMTPEPLTALTGLDEGSTELLQGLMGALNVRATIQQALGVVMERDRADAASAYVTVRLQAAEAARSIIEEAHAVIGAQR